jgi:hypothetical protein
MLEDLCAIEEVEYAPTPAHRDAFTSDEKASPIDLLEGKIRSDEWLSALGVDDDSAITDAQQQAAREAFTSLAPSSPPTHPDAIKAKLAQIQAPPAVKHLVGMLTAYDWTFVDQAKEIRGYCVAQLIEETKHPDAKYRLRALEILGKVTEVALFTERVEVKHTEISDEELENQIKERMEKYVGLLKVVEGEEIEEEVNKKDAEDTQKTPTVQ